MGRATKVAPLDVVQTFDGAYPMSRRHDLSRSLVALEQTSTLIAVIEMSLSSWLVAGVVPGLGRDPLKKTPQFHHWHHGIEKEAIDVNFAATFPWLDRLFGAHHLPDRGRAATASAATRCRTAISSSSPVRSAGDGGAHVIQMD
jgi:hypothetical protein